MGRKSKELWAVILAGGEGSRMARLTKALYGAPVPKQYAALLGERSFLQETVARARAVVPPERTLVAVSAAHADRAREQLAGAGVELIVQPESRGTGPGLLLPLAHLLARSPTAKIAVFPSDHHFERPSVFLAALRRALEAADEAPSGVALIGAEADHANTDYGWIVPRAPLGGAGTASLVETFVEKPGRASAERLLLRGGLWNTLVLAAHAQSLWRLAARHLPEQAARFAAYRRHAGKPSAERLLVDLYRDMPRACVSRDVLERAEGLAVVPMVGSGWSDCGTPERLVRCLTGKPELDRLRHRLGPTGPAVFGAVSRPERLLPA
jgi:mannose-1-phosphate guanylyltransferase